MLGGVNQGRGAEDGEAGKLGPVGYLLGSPHHLGRVGGEQKAVFLDKLVYYGNRLGSVVLVVTPDHFDLMSLDTTHLLVDVLHTVQFGIPHGATFLRSNPGVTYTEPDLELVPTILTGGTAAGTAAANQWDNGHHQRQHYSGSQLQ